MPATQHIVMTRSAKVNFRTSQPYKYVAIVEIDPSQLPEGEREPRMISPRARGVVRVVEKSAALWAAGTTESNQFTRTLRRFELRVPHLNRLARAKSGEEPIHAEEIRNARNEEMRRELLDAYGGLEKYFAETEVTVVHSDETGDLIAQGALTTSWGGVNQLAIAAVRVKCPSTGRLYILRVPPWMRRAREAVAWTFGLTEEEYRPAFET